MPLATRDPALTKRLPVASMLRHVLRQLLVEYGIVESEEFDRMDVYERRSEIYIRLMREPERTRIVVRKELGRLLVEHDAADLVAALERVLEIDAIVCPIVGVPTACAPPNGSPSEAHSSLFNALCGAAVSDR